MNIINCDVRIIADSFTKFTEEHLLISIRITITPDNTNDDFAKKLLVYLCFTDIYHIFENVVHTSEARTIFQNDVIFLPPIYSANYSSWSATRAGVF